MRTEMTRSRRTVIALILLLLVGTLPYAESRQKDRYEFRGKIVRRDEKPFSDILPLVFLQASSAPFTAQTFADPAGRFKFKNLLPGMYTLIIVIPQAGQTRQSVDVGPSFADANGKIEATVLFDPTPSVEDLHTVSALQLSIPEKARRQYEKAQERLARHDVPGAVKYLKNAVDLAPKFVEAWNNLGTVSYQTQDYKQAEEYFREALKHEPDAYAPLVNLGGALLSQGKAQESLPINLQAVKFKPDDALAHSQLGQSYYFLGQLENAEKHLKRAKTLDPRHFSFPQLVLAEIYKQRPDYLALTAELEEFLRYHPDSQVASTVRKTLERAQRLLQDGTPSRRTQ
ncbi:MAG: tetratricopeptide repeat protein [Acidobacteria bacterium]|nr:tetratricopeptide repeat protein [Acidobacteriota bacterium]